MRNSVFYHRQKGLTLVELLVAIAVLAVIAVLGWRGLDSILRTRIALTSELEQTRGMQLTFAQLQSDCSHLAVALPRLIPLQVGQDRITMVLKVFADNQPPGLQVIAYRVKNGLLTRRESAATRDLAALDLLWQAMQSEADSNTEVVLQSGVAELKMRLWSNGGWNTMPVANMVPGGLEVALQLQGRSDSLLKIFLLGAE